jgi:hypothetical protein
LQATKLDTEGNNLRDSEAMQQDDESGMMYEEECNGFYSSSGQAYIRIPSKR